ncbi:SDR family NAD(P)-dependent oxidoreductase [Pantoea sp. BAV 3049]|uniref:SDR family NAD(P)-dependent oxidoreductase n=1 Tax=Pantoea sp. BAV 3049 TaxID=2654188 RepID=UPI00131D4462|nr:SDR family NAD(P)-dependent oxidoreductase [Pantoea sp. BAV 3049]
MHCIFIITFSRSRKRQRENMRAFSGKRQIRIRKGTYCIRRIFAAGRVINMSSVGGRFSAPFLGAYAASKHALEGASESLRRELQLYGIEVILIEPGFVNTPILDKAIQEDYSRYRETDYGPIIDRFVSWFIGEGRKGMKPEVVGEAVYTALTHQNPQVCYTLVQQKWKNWTLPRLLPKRMVDRAIGKQLGLIKRDR